jgi:DHA1 family multidrug resistance protein-like MFS transporter
MRDPVAVRSDSLEMTESADSHRVRAVALLMALVLVVSLGYGAGAPLLPLYVKQFVGAAAPAALAWHVGAVGGTYTFALFVFAPMWGRASDTRGRNITLAWGFGIFLVGGVASALAPNLAAVYAARLLAGAGAAAVMPAAQAYIADFSAPVARSRRFVLLGSASFVGFLAGPLIGNWLAGPVMNVPAGVMPAMVDWPWLALAVAGFPILLLVPLWIKRQPTIAPSSASAAMSTVRARFVRASMLLAGLSSFATGTFEVGFNLFGGQTLRLTSGTIAIMFMTCSVAMLAAQAMLLLPGVRRRINGGWMAAVFVFSALALLFVSIVPNAASFSLFIGVVAASVGMIGPVLSYELLDRGDSAHGALLGKQAAAGNLGQALGSFAAGWLFTWQPAAPFWAAALALLIGAIASVFLWGTARVSELALESPRLPSDENHGR